MTHTIYGKNPTKIKRIFFLQIEWGKVGLTTYTPKVRSARRTYWPLFKNRNFHAGIKHKAVKKASQSSKHPSYTPTKIFFTPADITSHKVLSAYVHSARKLQIPIAGKTWSKNRVTVQ